MSVRSESANPPNPSYSSSTTHLGTLVEQASDAYALGDLDRALALYTHVLLAQPDNNVLHANISAILLRLDRTQEALDAANKAVQLCPEWAKAHFRRGEVLFVIGQYAEAVLAHAQAFHLEPDVEQFRTTLIASAKLDATIGEHFCCLLAQLQQAALQHDSCALLAAIGECFVRVGEPRHAVQILHWASQLQCSHSGVRLCALGQLAEARTQLTDWSGALEAMEQQLEVALDLGDLCAQRAIHCALAQMAGSQIGDWGIAIAHQRECVRMALSAAESITLKTELAHMCLQSGDFECAQREYKLVLEAEPLSGHALLGLGQALLCTGNLTSALALFNRVEQLEMGAPIRRCALVLKCHCYLCKGDAQKAAELAAKLAKENGVEVFMVQAHVWRANGNSVEALRWAKRALRELVRANEEGGDPRMVWTLQMLMLLYADADQRKNASRIAHKLWLLLEGCCPVQQQHSMTKGNLLEDIAAVQRRAGNVLAAKSALQRRIDGQTEKDAKWSELALQLAEMHLACGEGDCAEALVREVDAWNVQGGDAKCEIRLLTLKAQLLREEQPQEAVAMLEGALMLAQEAEEEAIEADICTRLGEWHAEGEGHEDEAIVYLRQVIAQCRLGHQPHYEGREERLLRAYSTLADVHARLFQWEDAFAAARYALTLQKELERPVAEQLRTQLLLAKGLLERRDLRMAGQLLRRVRRAAKRAGAKQQIAQAVALLAECKATKCNDPVEVKPEEEEEEADKCQHRQRWCRASNKNYRNRGKRSASKRSQESDGEWLSDLDGTNSCCLTGDSDAESTVSGAHVLGVDLDAFCATLE